jgi:hypothetical protein
MTRPPTKGEERLIIGFLIIFTVVGIIAINAGG